MKRKFCYTKYKEQKKKVEDFMGTAKKSFWDGFDTRLEKYIYTNQKIIV